MADNTPIVNANSVVENAATDELSDSSKSPKVSVLDGTGSPVPISPATSGNQTALNTLVGSVTEAAPASDTASSGLNGRLQRIAQRITSLIAQLPAALTGSGNLKVALVESTASQAVTGTFFQATQPVSIAGTVAVSVAAAPPLPTGTTATSRSIASATGSSENVMAANAARKRLLIINDAATNWTINLVGGTASVGGTDCVTLYPGDSLDSTYTNAITAIGTAASKLTALEW